MANELYNGVMQAIQQLNSDVGPAMLAKWGTDQDNDIRAFGSTIQSPTVNQETQLNFEKRILKPNSYPVIQNEDGTDSTHRMAYSEVDGKYVAYPTIVQKKEGGQLTQLGDREAFEYAMKTGEYRQFNKESDADSYAAGGYKKFWGLGEKQ